MKELQCIVRFHIMRCLESIVIPQIRENEIIKWVLRIKRSVFWDTCTERDNNGLHPQINDYAFEDKDIEDKDSERDEVPKTSFKDTSTGINMIF